MLQQVRVHPFISFISHVQLQAVGSTTLVMRRRVRVYPRVRIMRTSPHRIGAVVVCSPTDTDIYIVRLLAFASSSCGVASQPAEKVLFAHAEHTHVIAYTTYSSTGGLRPN